MTSELRPDSTLLHYRLLAPARAESRDVWRAEDTRSVRTVALKILSRSAPKEKGRRDALLSKLRQAAAIVHPAFPSVYEITATDEGLLVMALEWIEGESLAEKTSGGPISRDQTLKWAWQLAEALNAMHKHGLVHANFSPNNIIIDADGNLRLLGLNVSSLSDRRERGDLELLLRSGAIDVEAFSRRSPEELSGKPVDVRSDVFSFGTIVYQMATGRPPYAATTPQETVEVVTKTNPRNPMELNPQLSPQMFQLIGKSIFKNPSSRYADFDTVLAELEKIEPKIRTIAAYPKGKAAVKQVVHTITNLFVAELPYYDLLSKKEPERAVRLSARMQQILGEAVYLFDGEVIDSIGPRMIAVVPDAGNALRAARKATEDLLEYNAMHTDDAESIEPRIVLHRDEIARRDLSIEGRGVELLTRLVRSLEPMQLLVSEPLLRAAGESGDVAGEFEGVKFSRLPAEKAAEPPAMTEPVTSAPAAGEPSVRAATAAPVTKGAAAADAVDTASPPAKRKIVVPVVAAAVILLAVATAAIVLMKKSGDDAVTAAPVPQTRVAKPSGPPKLYVDSFAAATTDPATAANAALIAPAVAELLRQSGKVEIVSAPDPSALTVTAKPATDPAAGVVPGMSGMGEGPALQLTDAGAAVTQLLTWIGQQLKIDTSPLVSTQPAAMESFARAAAQYRSGDAKQTKAAEASVVDAVSRDPNFIPAHRLALEIFSASGDRKRAIEAAERLAALNAADVRVLDQLMTWKVEQGEPESAIPHAGAVLARDPSNLNALQLVARYALSVGDEKLFQRVVQKIDSVATPEDQRYIHRPDIFAVAGDNDRAATAYYDIEAREQNNPVLALKIGRIAALRESWEIAEIELKKLMTSSPDFGAPLLQAYIAAKKGDGSTAAAHLDKAIAGAEWNDDVFTAAAEIHALLNQKARVIEALERASARGEANITAVLVNQPFFYIGYDARSTKLKSELEAKREALERALLNIRV